jgi:pyroglutamyl-peptidase
LTTVLITGFGPFPGAPFNPTGPLVRHLSRLRRPRLGSVKLIGHVFETSYAAVDRDLPRLIAEHRPEALLMFGVATRRKRLSIELRARNALALLPDASKSVLARHVIAQNGPTDQRMPMPCQALLTAAHQARVPAAFSHDAGKYLCNYVCWRAADAVAQGTSLRLAAFVHVPPLARTPRPIRRKRRPLTSADLARAGETILMALAAAARRP